ncbi:MAG: hypothetical protein H0X57_08750 [Rubrobacter sp.]|jgi:hypothetical protein|nr:hypothetical protein [Rubrobacter sp.]
MTTAEREREELWEGSMWRDREHRRREIRAAWFAFFSRMAQSHAGLSRDYERRAEELCKSE